jgi:hypothetical protein
MIEKKNPCQPFSETSGEYLYHTLGTATIHKHEWAHCWQAPHPMLCPWKAIHRLSHLWNPNNSCVWKATFRRMSCGCWHTQLVVDAQGRRIQRGLPRYLDGCLCVARAGGGDHDMIVGDTDIGAKYRTPCGHGIGRWHLAACPCRGGGRDDGRSCVLDIKVCTTIKYALAVQSMSSLGCLLPWKELNKSPHLSASLHRSDHVASTVCIKHLMKHSLCHRPAQIAHCDTKGWAGGHLWLLRHCVEQVVSKREMLKILNSSGNQSLELRDLSHESIEIDEQPSSPTFFRDFTIQPRT